MTCHKLQEQVLTAMYMKLMNTICISMVLIKSQSTFFSRVIWAEEDKSNKTIGKLAYSVLRDVIF